MQIRDYFRPRDDKGYKRNDRGANSLELSVLETRVSPIRGLTFARTSHAEKTMQRYEREDEWRTLAFRIR